MRQFASVAALLVASTTACDPKKLRFTYFTDEKCMTLNEDKNKYFAKVDPSQYKLYDDQCDQQNDRLSVIAKCDAKTLQFSFWSNTKCEGKKDFSSTRYTWGKCVKGYGGSYKVDYLDQPQATMLVDNQASREKCDSKLVKYEWYTDTSCKNLNKEKTKQFNEVNALPSSGFNGKCQELGSRSSLNYCGAKAMHTAYYSNSKCDGKEDWTLDVEFGKCLGGTSESFKLVKTEAKCDTKKVTYKWYSDKNCKNLDVEQTKKHATISSYDGTCSVIGDRSHQATCDAKAMYVHFYPNKKCEGKETWAADYNFEECMSGSETSFKLTNGN